MTSRKRKPRVITHDLTITTQDVTQSGLGFAARWGQCSCTGWWFKSIYEQPVADDHILDDHRRHVAQAELSRAFIAATASLTDEEIDAMGRAS